MVSQKHVITFICLITTLLS